MERIHSIDDPRVAPYRNLPDRTLRGQSLFITEGRLVTLRLLDSPYQAESVFCAERFAQQFRDRLDADVPLYVAEEALLAQVVGFKFHLGVLAVGRRPEPQTLEGLMASLARSQRLNLVVGPQITKPENLGLVFRSAAALGADALALGRRSCDPFGRRCLRVSMGASLQLPFCILDDVPKALDQLHRRWQFHVAAAVADSNATPIHSVHWPPRTALLVGNEYEGLPRDCLQRCQSRITIPMEPAVDSLNLGVAAGIFLYEMTRYRRPCRPHLRGQAAGT
ncbi:MAG TPA: RNA methyltransferase [Planctomycetaceae bacterium]|nr:RNA methyltransferase [Planctomycetaceae bacterium]HIQ21786.1 RNA methyltransferase [Planctomycetota bacterium]